MRWIVFGVHADSRIPCRCLYTQATYAHLHTGSEEFEGAGETVAYSASAKKMLPTDLGCPVTQLLTTPPFVPALRPPVLLGAGVLDTSWGLLAVGKCSGEMLKQQRPRATSCVLFSDLWSGVN